MCLLTWENPQGSITNSDLELTAAVAHHNMIASQCRVAETTIATLHDNFATVMWNIKGSATAEGPVAYLLQLQELHARHYRNIPCHNFILGQLNAMADKSSHSCHLSDTELLTFLTLTFHSHNHGSYACQTPEHFLR